MYGPSAQEKNASAARPGPRRDSPAMKKHLYKSPGPEYSYNGWRENPEYSQDFNTIAAPSPLNPLSHEWERGPFPAGSRAPGTDSQNRRWDPLRLPLARLRESDCDESQEGMSDGFHFLLSLTMALIMVNSFLMHAVMTTLNGFPFAFKRLYSSRMMGLQREALTAAI